MEFLEQIKLATVQVLEKGKPEGQGVILPNGYILTVGHCVGDKESRESHHYDGLNFYALLIKDVKTNECRAKPICLEIMRDIAVLGEPDSQCVPQKIDSRGNLIDDPKASKEYLEYKRLVLEGVKVPIFLGDQDIKDMKVFCLEKNGEWNPGIIEKEDQGKLFINCRNNIIHGSSGGPIVTESGELIGLISAGKRKYLNGPFIKSCLPQWMITLLLLK